VKLTSAVVVAMTTSKVVDQSKLTAYERWELPVMNGKTVSSSDKVATAKELESIQKQAYDESFSQGKKDGYAQGKAEVEQNAQALRSMIELLAEPLKELDDDIVLQLAELAMAVAKQVIRRELHSEQGEIVGIVREAVSALPASSRKVILHISPDDSELVRNAFSIGEQAESQEFSWKIVEDPMLSRGGCKITSDNSQIDATVEARLNRVINTLLGGERETDA
jgi:flagellar assembly protein FliH